jgi:uncharacterized protein YndB with AHSA1/START domain
MEKPTFVYEIYIDTTAEELWKALTSPDYTEKYWGGRRIRSDWKKGSPVEHIRPDGGSDWHGEVLIADPPKHLSYTFITGEVDGNGNGNRDGNGNGNGNGNENGNGDGNRESNRDGNRESNRDGDDIGDAAEPAPSQVTFDLEPYGEVIRLKVTHEFNSIIDPEIRGGWIAIISSLKSLLETDSALTYPWKG